MVRISYIIIIIRILCTHQDENDDDHLRVIHNM